MRVCVTAAKPKKAVLATVVGNASLCFALISQPYNICKMAYEIGCMQEQRQHTVCGKYDKR